MSFPAGGPTDQDAMLRQLRVIFGALLSGQILFLVVVLIINKEVRPQPIYSLVLPAAVGAQLVTSWVMRGMLRRRLAAASAEDVNGRAMAILAAHLVPWALIEGASLFSVVVFLITGTAWPGLVIGGGCMVAFGLSAPTKAGLSALYRS